MSDGEGAAKTPSRAATVFAYVFLGWFVFCLLGICFLLGLIVAS
jgi:hypothetical protein